MENKFVLGSLVVLFLFDILDMELCVASVGSMRKDRFTTRLLIFMSVIDCITWIRTPS